MMEHKRNKEEILNKLKETHDIIKEHPYWKIFDHAMYKNELFSLYRELMNNMSELYHYTDYDSPVVCIHKTLYHDFSRMICLIRNINDVESSDDFKMFYLPTLQAYLQLIHLVIDKNDNDPECIQMILPNDISHPTRFTTFIPEYKENWTTDDGYIISYTTKKGYNSVIRIREDEIDKYKNEINKAIEKYKNPKISERLRNTMFEWFNVCLKDINERTSFVYKIV